MTAVPFHSLHSFHVHATSKSFPKDFYVHSSMDFSLSDLPSCHHFDWTRMRWKGYWSESKIICPKIHLSNLPTDHLLVSARFTVTSCFSTCPTYFAPFPPHISTYRTNKHAITHHLHHQGCVSGSGNCIEQPKDRIRKDQSHMQ